MHAGEALHAERQAGRNSMHGLLDRQAKPAGRLTNEIGRRDR